MCAGTDRQGQLKRKLQMARAWRAFWLFAGFGFFGLVAIRFGLDHRLFRARRAGRLRRLISFRRFIGFWRSWGAGLYRSGSGCLFDLSYQSRRGFKSRRFAADGFGADRLCFEAGRFGAWLFSARLFHAGLFAAGVFRA